MADKKHWPPEAITPKPEDVERANKGEEANFPPKATKKGKRE